MLLEYYIQSCFLLFRYITINLLFYLDKLNLNRL